MRKVLAIALIALLGVTLVFAAGKSEKPAQSITFAAQSTPAMDYLVSLIRSSRKRPASRWSRT